MIVEGFVSWASRRDGVPDKVYAERNRGLGLIGHSIVGRERRDQDGIPDRFLSTEKDAEGSYTANAAASCMFVLRLSGELIQMYPVWSSTWTSGGRVANTSYWAIEAEGGDDPFDEPLNEAQVLTLLRLCDEYEAYTGRTVERGSTFREHGEIARELGYAATACPSNRYRTFYAALEAREKGEPGMTPEQLARLELLERIVAGNGIEFEGKRITGAEALQVAASRGWSAFLGIKLLRDDVGALQAQGEVIIGGVPDHTHTAGGVER